jgi:hypothetical protein
MGKENVLFFAMGRIAAVWDQSRKSEISSCGVEGPSPLEVKDGGKTDNNIDRISSVGE